MSPKKVRDLNMKAFILLASYRRQNSISKMMILRIEY